MNVLKALWRGIHDGHLPPPTRDDPAIAEARRAESRNRRSAVLIAASLRRGELAKLEARLARSLRQ